MGLKIKKFVTFFVVLLASLFVVFASGSSMGMELFRNGKGEIILSVNKEKVEQITPDRESFESYFNGYVKAINSASGEITALTVKKYAENDTHYLVTVKTRRIDKIKGLGKLLYTDTQSFLGKSTNKDELRYGYNGTLMPTLLKTRPDSSTVTYGTYYEIYEPKTDVDENGETVYFYEDVKDTNGETQKKTVYTKADEEEVENPFKMEAKSVESGEKIKNFKALQDLFSATDKNKIVFFQMADFEFVDEITLKVPGKVKYVSTITNTETGEEVETVSASGKGVSVKAMDMRLITKDKVYVGCGPEDTVYDEMQADPQEESVKVFYGYFVYEQGISPVAIAGIIVGGIGLITFLVLGIVKGWFKRFFQGKVWKAMLRYKLLYLLILPALVLLILFRYLPMLWLGASFMDYDLFESLGSEWIGLHYFKGVFFATNTVEMYRIFRNTIFISLIRILSNLPVILFLAILINSIKNRKGRMLFQAVSFIPYFLSWVSVGGIFNALLDSNYGMINRMFGLDINWYGYAEPWWTILSVSSLWKGMGWSTLIYISAMCNIDNELYEACSLDGGGKLRQVFTVTLPGIMNIICLQLILDVSNIMRDNYEQILAMTNGQMSGTIQETVDVVGRIAYTALNKGNFGSATAIGLIQGLIGSGLVLITNKIVKKTENEGII